MNILIAEGNVKLDDDKIERWSMRQPDAEIKYLYNAYNQDKKKIIELFNWCDVLIFHTTFWEQHKIIQLAMLLASIKKPMLVYIDCFEAKQEVLKLLNSELAYGLLHHKIYEFEYYSNKHIFISLVKKASYHKRKLKLEVEKQAILGEYKRTRRTAITGRKIRIKKIIAFGKLFNELVEGSIVDEIDNSKVDNEPHRGVWVWGNGEPVKLLKEDSADEYDIVNSTKETIVSDIMKVANIPLKKEIEYLILGILNDKEKLDKANSICEILKIPKRINRENIRRLLVNV